MPVPVWLTLGSWNPLQQTLRDWVAATLARDHPYLRAVDFGPDAITGLLDGGRVASVPRRPGRDARPAAPARPAAARR